MYTSSTPFQTPGAVVDINHITTPCWQTQLLYQNYLRTRFLLIVYQTPQTYVPDVRMTQI